MSTAMGHVDPVPIAPACGPPDDLTRIRGITRKLADALGGLGVTHYATIANWRAEDVARIAGALDLGRQISRQNWIEQAAILAMRAAPQLVVSIPRPAAGVSGPASAQAVSSSAGGPAPRSKVAAEALAAIVARLREAPKRSPAVMPATVVNDAPGSRPDLASLLNVAPAADALHAAASAAVAAATQVRVVVPVTVAADAAAVPSDRVFPREWAALFRATLAKAEAAAAASSMPPARLKPLEPVTVIRAAEVATPVVPREVVPPVSVSAPAPGDAGVAAPARLVAVVSAMTPPPVDLPHPLAPVLPRIAPYPAPGPVSAIEGLSAVGATEAVAAAAAALLTPLPDWFTKRARIPEPPAPEPELPPDPLELIAGIDAETARRLSAFGVKHFKTIAGWRADDVILREVQLLAPRRIRREGWIEQAALLARGVETAYAAKRAAGWHLLLTPRPVDAPWIPISSTAEVPVAQVPNTAPEMASKWKPATPLPPAPPPVMPRPVAPPPAAVAPPPPRPPAEPPLRIEVHAPAYGSTAIAAPVKLAAVLAVVETSRTEVAVEPVPPEPVYIPEELEEAPEVTPVASAEPAIEPGGAAALAAAAAAASVMTAALKASGLQQAMRHRRSLAEALQPLAPAAPLQDLRRWSIDTAEEFCPPPDEVAEDPDLREIAVAEAEVVIVARDPATDAGSLEDLRGAAAAAAFKARRKQLAASEEFDAESYAAYRGEVEEAAVEIITRYPSPASDGASAAAAAAAAAALAGQSAEGHSRN